MKNIPLIFTLCFFVNCFSQTNNLEVQKKNDQILIVKESLVKAYQHRIISKEFQNYLDEGLKKDSTIAYLWQQKAMAYFKARKYEVGMKCIDKAVQYDAPNWQPYRAFIKCIFAKTYKDAIIDFEDCIKKFGNNYVMDHTYRFYIGLCYLQLNEFDKAEKIMQEYSDSLYKERQGLEHHIVLFYLGISKYEQQKWEEAISVFDKTLKIYPNFSDLKFYKSICLTHIGKDSEASVLLEEAKNDAKSGYTINEDNAVYEKYPYQIIWH